MVYAKHAVVVVAHLFEFDIYRANNISNLNRMKLKC